MQTVRKTQGDGSLVQTVRNKNTTEPSPRVKNTTEPSPRVRLSSYTGEYTTATYIKGDFSESYEYFAQYAKDDSQNEAYNFLTNNCSQVVIRGIRKGTLNDGTSVSSFMGIGYSVVPNAAAGELKETFFNDKFTYRESHKQINDMLWDVTEGPWYKRDYWLGKKLEKLW